MPTWLADGKEHFGGAEGLAELKEIAQSLAEPWRSSILWIPEHTEIPEPSNVAYWPTVEWDNKGGLITLAGDAAHPLPPRKCGFYFSPYTHSSLPTVKFESTRASEMQPGLSCPVSATPQVRRIRLHDTSPPQQHASAHPAL